MRALHFAVPAAAAVLHRGHEERPVLCREKTRLVRPVFEQAAVREQPVDCAARIRACARRDRDPVAALDGRDRIELDAREPAHRLPRPRGPSRGAPGRRSPGRRRSAGGAPEARSRASRCTLAIRGRPPRRGQTAKRGQTRGVRPARIAARTVGVDVAARHDADDAARAGATGERRREREGARALGDDAGPLGEQADRGGRLSSETANAPASNGRARSHIPVGAPRAGSVDERGRGTPPSTGSPAASDGGERRGGLGFAPRRRACRAELLRARSRSR